MRNILSAAVVTAAIAAAGCGDGRDPLDPTGAYTYTATGTVHVLNGAVPTGLVARVTGTTGTVTFPVGSDGRFSIQAQVQGDSVDVIIDVQNGGVRTLLPSLVRVAGRPAGQQHSVVMVPAIWTVPEGTYAGTAVPVSMDAAFRRPCNVAGDTNCDGFYPIDWVRGVKLWQAAMLPVRLAFDHAGSHQPITPADSIALWQVIGTMNADMGVQLFRPAQAPGLTFQTDGRPNDTVVVVRADTTLTGFSAWTSWWWNAAGDLIGGVVRARSTAHIRSAGLMTHELLHTQGFKHSCAWTTVMGGYGCSSATRLTAHDVAHVQVARAMRARQQATGAAHGLVAALQGERVVLLGLSPLPPAATQRLAVPPLDLFIQGDSVFHSDHAH